MSLTQTHVGKEDGPPRQHCDARVNNCNACFPQTCRAFDLEGKVVGTVGAGRIGQLVLQRLGVRPSGIAVTFDAFWRSCYLCLASAFAHVSVPAAPAPTESGALGCAFLQLVVWRIFRKLYCCLVSVPVHALPPAATASCGAAASGS